jgi:hypothetical protein
LAGDRAAVLELIGWEFALRRRREPGLQMEEYVGRFPEFAADLKRLVHATPDATLPTTPSAAG